MGRFDSLFKKMGDVADPQVNPGDEAATAENPRNWVSDKVNQVLPDNYQIPLQTVADDKQFMQKLPETIAGGTMGSIKNVGAAPRFGKLAQEFSHADVMNHPEMLDWMKNNKLADRAKFPSPSQYTTAKQALINKIQGQ